MKQVEIKVKGFKKYNPHAWFFQYMKKHHEDEEQSEARKAIVKDYSNGKTESLEELYKNHKSAYNKLRRDISYIQKQHLDRQNKQRRKLLALIYTFCQHKKYTCTQQQAVQIACKTCGVRNLNDAPEQKLIAAIKRFDDDVMDMAVDELVKSCITK